MSWQPAVKYDPTGNLWVLNSQITNPLKMLSKDGEWSVMNNIGLTKNNAWDVKELFLSPTYGYMWFVNSYWEETKLFAYDYKNNKLYDAGGPTFTNEDNTTLKPYYLFHVTEDKNKNIWLSTSAGPLYMTPNDVKNGGGWVTQHKVPRNDGTNLADYLLSNVETRCIAVDGGNRKWIATSSGVFLISDDCNTQVEHFTTDNSPLLSNTVHYVLVDPNSSTVYFATDKGLCSYQSDATTPNEKMTKDNVYAYPNPVTPDYTGDITIVGLSYNADVKIVTTNGTLVNQGRSTGGSYRWNCCDLKRQARGERHLHGGDSHRRRQQRHCVQDSHHQLTHDVYDFYLHRYIQRRKIHRRAVGIDTQATLSRGRSGGER